MKLKGLMDSKEEPLLVVKYVWWKILRQILITIVPFAVLLYMMISCFVQNQYICGAFVSLLNAIILFYTLEALMTREFLFYKNKIIKRTLIFGSKIFYFNSYTYLSLGGYLFTKYLTAANKIANRRIPKIIYLNRRLLKRGTDQNMINVLSKISGREIDEFGGNAFMIPFIKTNIGE